MSKPDHDTIMGLIRQHFGPELQKAVTFERWKDGIEIDYPTAGIELFYEAVVAAERKRCADIAFRSIQIKTGSIGCALQVRDDILTGRRATMRPEEISALHAKAKAVDDSLQQS